MFHSKALTILAITLFSSLDAVTAIVHGLNKTSYQQDTSWCDDEAVVESTDEQDTSWCDDEAVVESTDEQALSDIAPAEVRALFYLWNNALATRDSRLVAARYASDAVLLPTVSDVPRTDYQGIKSYFDVFLTKRPSGEIKEGFIKIGQGWAQDSGVYEFTMGIDGSKVKARYSFTYVQEDDGQWKIAHHHSSVMPEGIVTVSQQLTEGEVRDLFNLWNAALAVGQSSLVASLYAKQAVLLPTVSDIPRTDYASIKNYFDHFLTKKPRGEIIESHIEIGLNWAQDAGIYEFSMGIDGSKVRGRYSFIYVLEDGVYKIAHHHSSVMPEAFLALSKSKQEPEEAVVENGHGVGLLKSRLGAFVGMTYIHS